MRVPALPVVLTAMSLLPRGGDGAITLTSDIESQVGDEAEDGADDTSMEIDSRQLDWGMNIYNRRAPRSSSKRTMYSYSYSTKGSSKSSKGSKGSKKGGHRRCASHAARLIEDRVPEVVTRNPSDCCYHFGPTAVIVTHAHAVGEDTESGFEVFWDKVYQEFLQSSETSQACFVFTGYDPDFVENGNRTLSDILIDVNTAASEIITVPSIMTTDPTTNTDLMATVRGIFEDEQKPSIGVFNAGFANVIAESLIAGKGRLPFIGFPNDQEYGNLAAEESLRLLEMDTAIPLCLNARPDLWFIGQRCEAFYLGTAGEEIDLGSGVDCSSGVNVTEVAFAIIRGGINAIFAHSDCCTGAEEAVRIARLRSSQAVVVGCMDVEPNRGTVDFVTTQPIELQAYHTFAFAAQPVIQAMAGENGRAPQYFPSLRTLVHTGIYNSVV